jgi:hypothetical protein
LVGGIVPRRVFLIRLLDSTLVKLGPQRSP